MIGGLLAKLPERLRGYATWVGSVNLKIVVLVDRDDDDCVELKRRLVADADKAGLAVSSAGGASAATVLNRIAVEELEAWFLGDVPAVRRAYPRVPGSVAAKVAYRDPDAIQGGTWESMERLLQTKGYFPGGLRKTVVAERVASYMDVENNRSRSFQAFRDGLRRLVSGGGDATAS